MDGNGIMKWPDGRKYEGGYSNDKKHGQGVLEWRNLFMFNVRQLMAENIQDNGNLENNMESENILMAKLIKKVNGTKESD